MSIRFASYFCSPLFFFHFIFVLLCYYFNGCVYSELFRSICCWHFAVCGNVHRYRFSFSFHQSIYDFYFLFLFLQPLMHFTIISVKKEIRARGYDRANRMYNKYFSNSNISGSRFQFRTYKTVERSDLWHSDEWALIVLVAYIWNSLNHNYFAMHPLCFCFVLYFPLFIDRKHKFNRSHTCDDKQKMYKRITFANEKEVSLWIISLYYR